MALLIGGGVIGVLGGSGGGNGSVAYGSMVWNPANFPDLVIEETLNVKNVSARTIPQKELMYNTTWQNYRYKVNENVPAVIVEHGLDINCWKDNITGSDGVRTNINGGGYYAKIGWQGIPYVAFNGRPNKITRLILEQNASDNKTLGVNETWDMGGGWSIIAQSIDAKASPRQVWLVLSKNGTIKDDVVLQQGQVYSYFSNTGGENNAPLFVTYVSSIFAGATSDFAVFKYSWVIDTDITEIRTADRFGVLNVTDKGTSDGTIKLRNDDGSIPLIQDSTINLMSNLYFSVSNNASLEYYPFFDGTAAQSTDAGSPCSGGGGGGGGGSGGEGSAGDSAILATSLEIRGEVFDMSLPHAPNATGCVGTSCIASWNANNFPGFWYDLDDSSGQERLVLSKAVTASDRIISKNNLTYSTTGESRYLKVVEMKYNYSGADAAADGLEQFEAGKMGTLAGQYNVVGWQGEKFVGIKNKTYKLVRLLVEHGASSAQKKTLSVGESWDIGEGWSLKANAIDAKATPRQVWLTLSKDGVKKDDKVVTSGLDGVPIYTYVEKNLGNEIDVPVFVTYVDSIFAGATTDLVQLRYTWALSTSINEIKVGDTYGVFKVSAQTPTLTLTNQEIDVTLTQDSIIDIMGSMKFKVADNSTNLRYYPMMMRTESGLHEVRGSVATGTAFWDAQNFAGFWYDLDNAKSSETLTINQTLTARTIDQGNLSYETARQFMEFKVHEKEGLNVEHGLNAIGIQDAENASDGVSNVRGGGYYAMIGWEGLPYVLLNGKTNKFSRLVFEQRPSEMKNMTVGETWNIGEGWTLTLDSVDWASPGQAFFILRNDGIEKDYRVVQEGQVYSYYATTGNETDVPLFVTFFDNMSRARFGAPADMVHFKYTWVVSPNVTIINAGDMFGAMRVMDEGVSNGTVKLLNDNKSIALYQDSVTDIIGNLKFKVADSTDLRFYPYIQILIPSQGSNVTSNIIVNATPMKILNDGYDSSKITASLTDKYGNIVANGTIVKFISNRSTDVFLESRTNIASTTTVNGIAAVYLVGTAPGSSKIIVSNNSIFGYANVNVSNQITETTRIPLFVDANMNTEVLKVADDAEIGMNTTGALTTDITASIAKNASIFNASNATAQYGLATGEVSLDRYLDVIANVSDKVNLSSVNISMFYNDADLDMNKNGILTDAGIDIDENSLKLYWWNGSIWKPLYPEGQSHSNENGPTALKIYRDTNNNKLTVKLNHFSLFAIGGTLITATPVISGSSSGGGGGGGGGGTSGENFSNIEIKEKHDMHIFKDKVTSYAFTSKGIPILFINITGNISAGEINTAVEVLRNTSTLVKIQAPGIVYKNTNVWVGTSGFAGPKNIKEAIIRFKVENSWFDNNKLAANDVRMMKWDGNEWIQLETALKEKDSLNAYFETKTDKFSHFAITGVKELEISAVTPTITVQAESASTATSNPVKGTPGFGVIMIIIAVSVVYVFRKS